MKLKDSVVHLATERLMNRRDIKGVPGLIAGLEQMKALPFGSSKALMDAIHHRIEYLSHPSTNLIDAVERNDLDEVKAWIDSGSSLSERGNENSTPLHWAVACGHVQAVKLLLSYGAGANIEDDRKISPLTLACSMRKDEIEEILRESIQ